jgi:phosphate acetyltransferase
MRTAVVYPSDPVALESVVAAAASGLINPILIGDVAKIEEVARQRQLDLKGFEIVAADDPREAAARAVALAQTHAVDAIMKGSLQSDDLLHAIASPDSGLHTQRRLSHAYVMELPGRTEPLLITDAVVNIAPDLAQKRDIVQNVVDLAHLVGLSEVRVAILSAIETVNPKVPATLDAAALAEMAERQEITGALVGGPLALDDALSPEVAAEKGIVSPVAGRANVLVVPEFQSGNILAKALILLAGAMAAGIVLGARVPIALTSRADSIAAHLASLAIARLLSTKDYFAQPIK